MIKRRCECGHYSFSSDDLHIWKCTHCGALLYPAQNEFIREEGVRGIKKIDISRGSVKGTPIGNAPGGGANNYSGKSE